MQSRVRDLDRSLPPPHPGRSGRHRLQPLSRGFAGRLQAPDPDDEAATAIVSNIESIAVWMSERAGQSSQTWQSNGQVSSRRPKLVGAVSLTPSSHGWSLRGGLSGCVTVYTHWLEFHTMTCVNYGPPGCRSTHRAPRRTGSQQGVLRPWSHTAPLRRCMAWVCCRGPWSSRCNIATEPRPAAPPPPRPCRSSGLGGEAWAAGHLNRPHHRRSGNSPPRRRSPGRDRPRRGRAGPRATR